MKYLEIAAFPESLSMEYINENRGCSGFHQSLLRSYHVNQKVRQLLEQKVPPEAILELMDLMEGK